MSGPSAITPSRPGKIKKQRAPRTTPSKTAKQRKGASVLDTFNQLSAFTWITLSTMEPHKLYRITQALRRPTTFGERLVLEFDTAQKLCLPERYYTSLTDAEVQDLNSGTYVLVNKGTAGGKSYKLELLRTVTDASNPTPRASVLLPTAPSTTVIRKTSPPPPPIRASADAESGVYNSEEEEEEEEDDVAGEVNAAVDGIADADVDLPPYVQYGSFSEPSP